MNYSFTQLQSFPKLIEKCAKLENHIHFPCQDIFPCIETWGELSVVNEELQQEYHDLLNEIQFDAVDGLDDYDSIESSFRLLHEQFLSGRVTNESHIDYYHSIKLEMTQTVMRRISSSKYTRYQCILKLIKNAILNKEFQVIQMGACKLYAPLNYKLEQMNVTFCDCSTYLYSAHYLCLHD